jgi:subtilase family serine protease
MKRRPRKEYLARCEQLEDRSLLSSLTPAQVRHAYGIDAISLPAAGQIVAGTGAGQTIAVVVAYHNPYLSNELQVFDATFGLAPLSPGQVNLAGGITNDGWAEEEALDVEWAHVMAPGAAIVTVEARSDSVSDLMAAVNAARQIPGVAVVSMSWGGTEFRGQAGYDSTFTTPAGHTGVTFVTASGDSGGLAGAQWPATSSHVVAVGGTTLQVDAQGNVISEAAWYGSGGGTSRIVARPYYQSSVERNRGRATPDVSMVADPNTGVSVYTISPSNGSGSWQIYGGTSLSAQLFGGLVAIVNQGRTLRGAGTLDGPSQTLPALYAVSANDYRDVTAGSNGYRTTRGYDLATGRGTPIGTSLVADLVGYTGQPAPQARRGRVVKRASNRSVVRPATLSVKFMRAARDLPTVAVIRPADARLTGANSRARSITHRL